MDSNLKENLKSVKNLIKSEKYDKAFSVLCGISQPLDNFSLQHRYSKLYQSLPKANLGLQPIKIGIIPTSTVDHFADVFKFWLAKVGFDADLLHSQNNTMDQTVLDLSGALYDFKPDIVWLFSNYRDVMLPISPGCSFDTVENQVQDSVDRFVSLWDFLQQNSSAYIVQNNADIVTERIFGNYEGTVSWGRSNLLRRFNIILSQCVKSGVTIFDQDYISSLYGKRFWYDERYWYHSKHAFSLDASGLIAFNAARLVTAIKGQSKKCIVLDLDNTLWGGVIGDDGLKGIKLGNGPEGEAYVDFQKYLLKLKSRGIILSVCSKNEDENAKLPFLSHPDMQLSLDDITVFIANWNNKADNIRKIAEILNIGMDSMVLIDDNPMERELVRKFLPMIEIPEIPEDPTKFIRAIDEQCYFETTTFSQEDEIRAEMYRDRAERNSFKKRYTDLTDFLKDLKMQAFVGELDSMSLPRISQLINKSNQFHVTTTRYTEAQIMFMVEDKEIIIRYFKLKDRFGDNGLISVIILKKQNQYDLYIDTWVMSCRVFSRGMEDFIHNEIVSIAQSTECKRLLGEYIPTKKNRVVSDLYKKFGYNMIKENNGDTKWELKELENHSQKNIFIERVDLY
jgi:FkbH-like protein